MTNIKRPASAQGSKKSDVKAPSKRSSVNKSKRPSSAGVSNKSDKFSKFNKNVFGTPYGTSPNYQSLKYITSYSNNNDWVNNEELRKEYANKFIKSKSKTPSIQNCINHNGELVYNHLLPGGEIFLAGGICFNKTNKLIKC